MSPGCYRPPSHKRYRVLKESHGDNGSSVSLLLTLAPEIPGESLFVSVELVKYSYDTVRIRVRERDDGTGHVTPVQDKRIPPISKELCMTLCHLLWIPDTPQAADTPKLSGIG